jgi:hypothetical protein
MLVLIGRSWLGRGRRRLIDKPDDWVGLEVGVALDRDIPMIPILVEGTPLPSREELPEQLRPLLTKQTAPLDNSSFESDIGRIEKAIATQVPLDLQEGGKGEVKHNPTRRILYAGVGGGVIVAIVAGTLFLLSQHRGPPPVAPLTASSAVLTVKSPELLTEDLLVKGFTGHLPANVSPNTPQLWGTPNGLTDPGLVASIRIPLNGPANNIVIWYHVFQNEGSASRFFYASLPYPNGYRPVGHLTAAGADDHTKCQVARQTTLSRSSSWGCLSLSGSVVSFSVVFGDSRGGGAELERELALDTIRHLQAVAMTTSHDPLGVPPGMTTSMIMTGSDLYSSLVKPFPPALVPAGLTSPTVHHYNFGASPPPGLLPRPGSSYIRVAFGRDPHSYLFFYVFDTARHARSWFADDLRPIDSSGHRDRPTGSLSKPSGFSASQQAQCGTYSQPGPRGTPALGVSACAVQWGNVVVFSRNDTAANHTKGNTDLALALARSGILRVAQTISH